MSIKSQFRCPECQTHTSPLTTEVPSWVNPVILIFVPMGYWPIASDSMFGRLRYLRPSTSTLPLIMVPASWWFMLGAAELANRMLESTSTGFGELTDVRRKISSWVSGLGAFFWSMKAIVSEARLNDIFVFEITIWMLAWLGQPTDSRIWWTLCILSNSERIYASMSPFVWMWFWSRSKIRWGVGSSYN